MAQARPRTNRTAAAAPAQRSAPAPAQRAMTTSRDALAALLDDEEGVSIVKPDNDVLEAITKSEVAMQLDAAHRWPRDVNRFLSEAEVLATFSKETAKSCIYTLPGRSQDGKAITGPSVRLAEMCATAWGNLHTGARIIDIGQRAVTAQAVAWDLEKNLRLSIEVQRGIVTKNGQRFGDDMIRVTGMAAISIALRNAIFRIVPRALVNHIYDKAEQKATGVTDNTFAQERDAAMGWFVNKRGIAPDRIYARLGIPDLAAMTPEHLATLFGIGTAIKTNEQTAEEAFPPPPGAVPAQPRSRNAHLDALTEVHKPRPAAALTPAEVHAVLVKAAPEWEGEDRLQWMTNEWTPAQLKLAHDWAVAFNDDSIPNDKVPLQPAFTIIATPEVETAAAPAERQPGEGA